MKRMAVPKKMGTLFTLKKIKRALTWTDRGNSIKGRD